MADVAAIPEWRFRLRLQFAYHTGQRDDATRECSSCCNDTRSVKVAPSSLGYPKIRQHEGVLLSDFVPQGGSSRPAAVSRTHVGFQEQQIVVRLEGP